MYTSNQYPDESSPIKVYIQYMKCIGNLCFPSISFVGEVAYVHIDVMADRRLLLQWTGKKPSDTVLPWPSEMKLKN